MSWRAIAILLLVLAAVVGYLLWTDRPANDDEADDPALVPIESLEAVVALELHRGKQGVRLERRDDGWRLVEPLTAAADPRPIETLLSALQNARILQVVAERTESLAPFGLDPPSSVLHLEREDGSGVRVRLGGHSPVGPERYAALDDDRRVLLTSNALALEADRSAEDFRERRFLPLPAERVRSIEIRRAGQRLALAREGTDWRLTAPLEDRADFSKVDALARWLTSAVSIRFPDDAETSRALAGCTTAPELAVAVAGNEIGERLLRFCGPDGSGDRYAVTAGAEPFLGVIAAPELDRLDEPADAYRDRTAVRVDRYDVEQLDLRVADRHYTLRRSADSAEWAIEGNQERRARLAPGELEAFLDQLRDLRIQGFARDAAATLRPDLELVLIGTEGELGRLRAESATDDPRSFRAESSWRPGFVIELRSDALAGLPQQAEQWLSPASASEEDGE